ncbi:sensor domain-containing protein [Actinoplanes sp. NPDC023936]|uniref:sensor domain-containing protein n=1 Tax=Actinoplanes sp. NPDC023936 TaxID=3154910 RepID=UPI0033EFD678
MTTIDAPLVSAPTFTRLAADTRYVLGGFPLGLAATIVTVTGFSLGLGLAVVWIGVPILIATMMMARGLAVTERARLGLAPARDYRAGGSSVVSRLVAVLTDPQSWRDLVHAVFRFIPSTIAFSFVVTWWAGVLGGLSWALWGWALPDDGMELPELLGFGDGYLTIVVFYLVFAVGFAATLPTVTRWAARFEAGFARALL